MLIESEAKGVNTKVWLELLTAMGNVSLQERKHLTPMSGLDNSA